MSKLLAMNNNILSNPVFISALCAMLIAQFVKPFIYLISNREWKGVLIFSNGGMPSSHTSTVCAMTTAVGLTDGFGSTLFVISLIFALVVMNDAVNVRLETGRQAELLNEWSTLFSDMFHDKIFTRKKFKTMVGHTVLQVFWGMIIGIAAGAIITIGCF